MSEPETKPFVWTEEAKRLWRAVDRARCRKNVFLGLAFGPYLLSGGVMALAGTGRTEDARAMLAVGGGILLIFLFIAPYWLFITLYEWWRARGAFRGNRAWFRKRYGIDPCLLFPPDRIPPPPAAGQP